jgi:hypothetical protein
LDFKVFDFQCKYPGRLLDLTVLESEKLELLSPPKENRSDSLPGYLPKLEFKYFKIMFHLTAVVHRIPELYG